MAHTTDRTTKTVPEGNYLHALWWDLLLCPTSASDWAPLTQWPNHIEHLIHNDWFRLNTCCGGGALTCEKQSLASWTLRSPNPHYLSKKYRNTNGKSTAMQMGGVLQHVQYPTDQRQKKLCRIHKLEVYSGTKFVPHCCMSLQVYCNTEWRCIAVLLSEAMEPFWVKGPHTPERQRRQLELSLAVLFRLHSCLRNLPDAPLGTV